MQRGFVPIYLLVGLLFGLILLGGGFVFYMNLYKNVPPIGNFEDCVKAGLPVLESYPSQCNTPDGRHFVQILSIKERQKISTVASVSPILTEKIDGDIYENIEYNFQINRPKGWQIATKESNPQAGAFPVNFYPPDVALINMSPDLPTLGVMIVTGGKLEEGNKSDKGTPFITDFKKIKVNGVEGVYYKTHQCAPQCTTRADFLDGDYTVSVFMSTVAEEKGYKKDFDQMLSTFKFLR